MHVQCALAQNGLGNSVVQYMQYSWYSDYTYIPAVFREVMTVDRNTFWVCSFWSSAWIFLCSRCLSSKCSRHRTFLMLRPRVNVASWGGCHCECVYIDLFLWHKDPFHCGFSLHREIHLTTSVIALTVPVCFSNLTQKPLVFVLVSSSHYHRNVFMINFTVWKPVCPSQRPNPHVCLCVLLLS